MGHIEFLKHARSLGDYLIVGVHEDEVVNRVKGTNNPIMALHERVMGVLSCRVRERDCALGVCGPGDQACAPRACAWAWDRASTLTTSSLGHRTPSRPSTSARSDALIW